MQTTKQVSPEEKIKYVLNGNVKYYTRNELAAYYKDLLQKNEVYFPDIFENDLNRLIEDLKKYDGDPHGYSTDEEVHGYHHRLEEMGLLDIHRSMSFGDK